MVGISAGMLGFLLVPPLFAEHSRVPAAVICVLLAAISAALVPWWRWRRLPLLISRNEAARLLVSRRPTLKNLVTSGVDISLWSTRDALERGASPSLARAHVQAAEAAAEDLSPSASVVPGQNIAWILALSFLLSICAAWIIGDSEGAGSGWRAIRDAVRPTPVQIGNLGITYEPPAYTGIPGETIEGSDGSISAYPGTKLTITGSLSAEVSSGTLSLSGDVSGEVPLFVSGTDFNASWILSGRGTYAFNFLKDGSSLPSGFAPRAVELIEDKRPEVLLERPQEDMQVFGDQEVEVHFSAKDDFWVNRVEIVLSGDKEVRIPVRISPSSLVKDAALVLPIKYPELGEGAHLSVEAFDNDSVSGPKAGSSRSIYISFVDRKKLISQAEELEERLFENFITHLADHLEFPNSLSGRISTLRSAAGDLLTLVDALIENLTANADVGSPASVAILTMGKGLHRVLEPFAQGGEDRKPVIAELEKDILLLDRFLKNLRMEKVLSMGEELAALQRSLFDRIQEGAGQAELTELLQRIQDLMSQMMNTMAKNASHMPQEFANSDALKEMPSSELGDAMENLKKALKSGDRDAASEAAERLLELMTGWMSAMEDAAKDASMNAMGMMMEDMDKLGSELEELMEKQGEIQEETASLIRKAGKKGSELTQKEFQDFLARQEQRLKAIDNNARKVERLAPYRQVHPQGPKGRAGEDAAGFFEPRSRMNAAMAEIRKQLRTDPARAREAAGALEQAFNDNYRNMESLLNDQGKRKQAESYRANANKDITELKSDLDALLAGGETPMPEESRKNLGNLAQEQGSLGDRTGEFSKELGKLLRNIPFTKSDMPGKAMEAKTSMKSSSSKLESGAPQGAMPHETAAMEKLSEVARDLESARREMEQTMQGQGSGGFRMLGKPGGQGEGGREVDRGRVEIPEEAEARELKGFREEVLKAMQSPGYPKDYESEVEEYYERLIK